jgi:hypothetical protein
MISIEGRHGRSKPQREPLHRFGRPIAALSDLPLTRSSKLYRVQAGLPKRVCRLRTRICDGASWSADSKTIVFTSGTPGVLWEVPAQGGNTPVADPHGGTRKSLGEPVRYIARPHFLPLTAGPRTLAFTVSTTARPTCCMDENLRDPTRESSWGLGIIRFTPLLATFSTNRAFPVPNSGRYPFP